MNEFKLIVAGGRDFNLPGVLEYWIMEYISRLPQDMVVSIVSGMARGADRLAYEFAKRMRTKVYEYPAQWDDLNAPGAIVRTNFKTGKTYNANAGFVRNQVMANVGDGLLVFWDGKSKGTEHMITCAKNKGIKIIIVYYVKDDFGIDITNYQLINW